VTSLFFRGLRIGALALNIAKLAQTAPQVFHAASDGFHLIATEPAKASAILNALLKTWHDCGTLSRWRDEQLDVLDPITLAPLFPLEREGRVVLGLTMTGAMVNGVTARDGANHLWIAQRAATKSIAPLQWDCLANGAVGAGETPTAALVREAWEEAGISSELMARALPAAQFTIEHREDEHVFYERAHCFDVVLPETFSPVNNDGEVERFACVSRSALAAMLQQRKFTYDATVAIKNWLERNR
jgi:8-oxo-dGTP pyrophosphatase MutT (NUDIX family)